MIRRRGTNPTKVSRTQLGQSRGSFLLGNKAKTVQEMPLKSNKEDRGRRPFTVFLSKVNWQTPMAIWACLRGSQAPRFARVPDFERAGQGPYREPVRVEFHLVAFERVPGAWRDVPTATIPLHLRRLGSRFLLVFFGITPEEQDTAEEIRAAITERIEELPTG